MAPKTSASRTVQYWRLVDARDGSAQADLDWHDIIARYINGQRPTFTIEGRSHAGTSFPIAIVAEWAQAFDLTGVSSAPPLPDPTVTYGIVIAAGKDFVPNQANTSTGDQQPMGLAGATWEPVDNLFVTFLPFGNIIGVLAESTSSSRAAKFADWLTRVMQPEFADSEFVWGAVPVLDPTRATLLSQASGLKSAIFAGEIGQNVTDASGIRSLFGGPPSGPDVKQVRVEIKASVVRGKSDHVDEAEILRWFNATFGSLSGEVDKAQVTLVSSDGGPTEIDLIHQRLTRKANVRLQTGRSRAFTGESAVAAILDAYALDHADLLRLR